MQQLTTTRPLAQQSLGRRSPDDRPLGTAAAGAELLRLADQCVKCGFCLPHCPTFRLRHDEAESPRGRIALVQGWLEGQLASAADAGGRPTITPGSHADSHLANCLECRACEPACPSLVRFGTLVDGARALREARRPAWQRWLRRTRLTILSDPRWLPLLTAGSRLYRRLGLSALLRRINGDPQAPRWPRLAALDRLAPALARPRPIRGPHAVAAVALFRGCIARSVEQPVAEAALRVLNGLDIPVRVPAGQGCCGAMHRHNGYPDTADGLRDINADTFRGLTVVGLASACVAELAEDSTIATVELCRFLVDLDWPADVSLAPMHATVAVHEPCSHRNVLRDSRVVYRLLERVPGVTLVALPANETCCGAAGTYVIDHPQTAVELAAPKVEALRRLAPSMLVTTNTGCALHLSAQARAAGLDIEVLHPVEVLARQLRSP